jgi:hypothetical protein
MSASLAAAKKRRAPISAQTPSPSPYTPQQNVPQQQGQPGGLTLPQVITLVDKRLTILESFVKNSPVLNGSSDAHSATQIPSNITEVLDEFNARTERLAEEIENLKNIVLSLQSYTMDVNKMLLEERAQLLGGVTKA